ncbi:MAG: hypothetical protein HXX08_11545 [Chloroflexi bacterium]|uniref:Uncharacterized protein n=1 Tax=Candidatus Chlorohelix allophototropha TaxID=3003348 RepID=A0A8T7LX14_9CHLR|nr:hypothetical protein [Chloroflexota bacterium]WJW65873.1 hypothetical protein OZ401_001652 [Chloroflexota bacterium L227-S17]
MTKTLKPVIYLNPITLRVTGLTKQYSTLKRAVVDLNARGYIVTSKVQAGNLVCELRGERNA